MLENKEFGLYIFYMTTQEFVSKATQIHGANYDLSKTIFVNWNTPITVICPIHGEFQTSPRRFIYRKHGCPKCRGKHISDSKRKTQENFLKECREAHGDKYDYSKAFYHGIDEEVDIICPIHGVFKQTPYNHINKKCGCPKCRYDMLSEKYRLPINTLKEKISSIQGDHYQYPYLEQEYINNRSEITIVCPIHGEFKQTMLKHLHRQGCPKCQQSKMEREIELFLKENNIEYSTQQRFDWLRLNKPLSLDFYLPQYNLAIECQGEQHFHPIKQFGGKEEFEKIRQRDKAKYQLCQEHGIPILYYSRENKNEHKDIKIINNQEELIIEIKCHKVK